ncbi:MAG: TonB-dependent receptor, partial [Elusimicrobiota bacterium]
MYANIAFTNAATDPRHNFGLAYLMRNGLAGAINPATGQPWPRGAIADGKLTWDNLNAWAGWTASEYVTNRTYSILTETVWTRWLSTQFNVLYNDYMSDRANGGIANLSAPLLNGNPLNTWANGATLSDVEQPTRRWAIRGAAMLTNSFFRERANSQTLLGYDIEWADSGPTDYGYFLADQNFNVVYNPALPTNLGRTPMPRIWWSVADGPQKKPMPRGGWVSPRLTFAGQNYVRAPNNPRDPSWVRPNNPLGLAQLAGLAGVSGQNNDGHHWENRTAGFYASNYTSWFGDRFATLVGVRANENFKRTPNITAAVSTPWAESDAGNRSYNLGLNARLTETLRPYYSFSSTYNIPLVNANGGVRDLVNPTGLNGAHNGPAGAKNQWTNLDRTTRGLELILTASPTPNWRVRLAATSADGRNLTDKKYPLLWNDQFHLRNGAVTYQNGAAFLVPVDPAVITARIANLNAQVDPAAILAQGATAPLTIAMMNDRTSPYWAQPADDNGRLQ